MIITCSFKKVMIDNYMGMFFEAEGLALICESLEINTTLFTLELNGNKT